MTKVIDDQMDALAVWLRKWLLAAISSEGLFLTVMLLFHGVLGTDLFFPQTEVLGPFRNFIIELWCGAILVMYLVRKKRRGGPENWLLAALILWIAVPFSLRFGTEHFTMYSTHDYALCLFVLYASISEADAKYRAYQLDIASAGACLLSIAVGGMLVYCATTGNVYYGYEGTEVFGVVNGQLQHATHYNTTGMFAVSCEMLCLLGFSRSKRKPVTLFYLVGVVLMALVIVLTQSRTARYAMLGAYAVGAWNMVRSRMGNVRVLLRHGAALMCGAVVLVGGYIWAAQITDAALAHYADLPAIVPTAIAEEAEETETEASALEARDAIDGTFSDRTNIWHNVLENWKNDPWHMLIGNGVGRTKWLVTKNTIHEEVGFASVHNAYLQFAADMGMIGFSLLAGVFLLILVPVLRAFFNGDGQGMPGSCVLGMTVIAALLTGLMESAPLQAMTPINMVLFFALGHLTATGREMKKHSK